MAAAPRPNRHEYGGPPPPGQGYYPSFQDSQTSFDERYDHGGQQAPRARPQQQQPYFDPPPREEFLPDHEAYDYGPPPRQGAAEYGHANGGNEYASPREEERQYPPPPPPPDETQLAPYDEEKADAEWRRGVEAAYAYPRQRRSVDSGSTRRPVYEDELMREQQQERADREREREEWLREKQYYEERERFRDERDRERERRKRRDEEVMREKALRYPSDPKKGGRDFFGSSEGERGLAAKIAGGAGGALIAHEVTDDALGTLGGILVGAIAANVLEKRFERKKQEKMMQRAAEDPYGVPVPYPPLGRDMDTVRRTGRDGPIRDPFDDSRPSLDDRSRPSRPTQRSSSGFRDRIKRSLSRVRSKSRRRRSESLETDDTHWR